MTEDSIFQHPKVRAQARLGPDWRENFRDLAQRALDTSWGLPEPQRQILGLAVQLDHAEKSLSLAIAAKGMADAEAAALRAQVGDLQDKVKGLELTLARYKARKGGKADD